MKLRIRIKYQYLSGAKWYLDSCLFSVNSLILDLFKQMKRLRTQHWLETECSLLDHNRKSYYVQLFKRGFQDLFPIFITNTYWNEIYILFELPKPNIVMLAEEELHVWMKKHSIFKHQMYINNKITYRFSWLGWIFLDHLMTNKLMAKYQHRFIRGRSCVT